MPTNNKISQLICTIGFAFNLLTVNCVENESPAPPNLDFYVLYGDSSFEEDDSELTELDEHIETLFTVGFSSIDEFNSGLDIHYSGIKTSRFNVSDAELFDTEFDTLRKLSEFTRTNGETVSVNYNRIRVFLLPEIDDAGSFGTATIGDSECLTDVECYDQYAITIAGSATSEYEDFRYALAHELGHYFGLVHAFDDFSCDVVTEGTSNRIMDYTDTPMNFADCEAEVYESNYSRYINAIR